MPWANNGDPGFLGVSHAPFTPNGDDLANLSLQNISLGRFDDCKGLLRSFDALRHDTDPNGPTQGLDRCTERPSDTRTSTRPVQAPDLPPRDVLSSQLLCSLSAPASKLVRLINEPASQLARVLQSKADQGGGAESAKATESAEPASATAQENAPSADSAPKADLNPATETTNS